MAEKKIKIIAENRKARHDFTIHETYEAGIELTGTEVKSLRAGKANMKDSYAQITKTAEVYVYNLHISPYDQGNRFNHEPVHFPYTIPICWVVKILKPSFVMVSTGRTGKIVHLVRVFIKRYTISDFHSSMAIWHLCIQMLRYGRSFHFFWLGRKKKIIFIAHVLSG